MNSFNVGDVKDIICQEIGGNHTWKYFPYKKENLRGIHNMERVVTVKDMAREITQICVELDDWEEYHQSTIVEVEGKISKQPMFVLIDLGSSHSYATPKVVESFSLGKKKHAKSWLIQLTTWTKGKVRELVKECSIELNGFLSQVKFEQPIARIIWHSHWHGLDGRA